MASNVHSNFVPLAEVLDRNYGSKSQNFKTFSFAMLNLWDFFENGFLHVKFFPTVRF